MKNLIAKTSSSCSSIAVIADSILRTKSSQHGVCFPKVFFHLSIDNLHASPHSSVISCGNPILALSISGCIYGSGDLWRSVSCSIPVCQNCRESTDLWSNLDSVVPSWLSSSDLRSKSLRSGSFWRDLQRRDLRRDLDSIIPSWLSSCGGEGGNLGVALCAVDSCVADRSWRASVKR